VKIKIFVDEDVHLGLAPALRKRGFDVIHAQELDRKGRTDREQLEWALQEKRCIVSFNVKAFVSLHNQFVLEGREHHGIIVSKQRPFGETLQRLLKIIRPFDQETIKNRIEFL